MNHETGSTIDELRHSEERFRLLVDSVRDYAIFMLDPQGMVLTWNSGAERFKGYKAHEIIGQPFSRFYPPRRWRADCRRTISRWQRPRVNSKTRVGASGKTVRCSGQT